MIKMTKKELNKNIQYSESPSRNVQLSKTNNPMDSIDLIQLSKSSNLSPCSKEEIEGIPKTEKERERMMTEGKSKIEVRTVKRKTITIISLKAGEKRMKGDSSTQDIEIKSPEERNQEDMIGGKIEEEIMPKKTEKRKVITTMRITEGTKGIDTTLKIKKEGPTKETGKTNATRKGDTENRKNRNPESNTFLSIPHIIKIRWSTIQEGTTEKQRNSHGTSQLSSQSHQRRKAQR